MLDFNKKDSKTKNFFRKNGLYIALAVCLVASGGAAVRYLGNGGDILPSENISEETNGKTPGATKAWDETLPKGEEAGADKTDVPDEREETRETETESETEPSSETEPATMANNELNTPYQSFYMMPCGTNIVKDYSNGELVYSDTMADWRSHNGVDFKAGKGTKVKAINDGIVINVYDDPMWGTVAEVDHGGELVAKYCGLGKNPPVIKGSKVKMNDDIGVVDSLPCEEKTGSHLHLEIKVKGKFVDPLAAMGKAN